MMKAIRLTIATLLLFAPKIGFSEAYGRDRLKEVLEAMKASKNMSYKYELTASYPNGQTDKVSGSVLMGNDAHIMYNDNDAMTMFYDGHWMVKADHRSKMVSVVDADKHLTKDYKEALEKDMFANNAISLYLDSVIRKYAIIKSVSNNGDTVHLDLRFPEKMVIRRMKIDYSLHDKMMLSYSTETFQPWRSMEYKKGKGTKQTITCWGFERADGKPVTSEDLFTVKKGKVRLKKFTDYTLEQKL